MATMKWETDTQYTEARIREVEPVDNGWGLYFDSGLVLGCTNGICQQAPTVGETARLYGKGFGQAVRGIIVEGRVYRYLSEAEEQARAEKEVAQLYAERSRKLEAERSERDARRAALPDVLQRRLDASERNDPDWRRDSESTELRAGEDAVRIAKRFPTIEDPKRFSNLSPQEQRAAVPDLTAGQTGNTFDMACQLAVDYVRMS
jgi:hypothetical protein